MPKIHKILSTNIPTGTDNENGDIFITDTGSIYIIKNNGEPLRIAGGGSAVGVVVEGTNLKITPEDGTPFYYESLPYRGTNGIKITSTVGTAVTSNDGLIEPVYGTGHNEIARGDHTHSIYAKIAGWNNSKVLVTNNIGNIETSDITTGNLNCLNGLNRNIKEYIDINPEFKRIVSSGSITAFEGNTRPSLSGLSMLQSNNNGYPSNGNVLTARGDGDNQLLLAWSGMYIRSRSVDAGANWSAWDQVYTTRFKPTPYDIGAAPASHSHNYLPLSGGTVTGEIIGNAGFNIGGPLTNGKLGSGETDIYLCNTSTNKYLQLKNDGTLRYSDQIIYHEGRKPSPGEIGAAPASHSHDNRYYTKDEINSKIDIQGGRKLYVRDSDPGAVGAGAIWIKSM